MFDEKRVEKFVNAGKEESMPYPMVFQGLKDAGVTSYKVRLEDYYAVYTDGNQKWVEPIPQGFHPLKIANDFDLTSIEEAIERNINNETTYVEFLEKIAAAGVATYVVEMSLNTVKYLGKDGKNFFIQNIPAL